MSIDTAQRFSKTRNLVILVGLWTGSSLVSIPLVLGSGHFFPYVASSNRAGSVFTMHLVNMSPMLVGAILAGIGAALLFVGSSPKAWLIPLMILITVQFIGSFYGWRWNHLGGEALMAMAVCSVLMMAAVLGGFWFGIRRLGRSGHAQSA